MTANEYDAIKIIIILANNVNKNYLLLTPV